MDRLIKYFLNNTFVVTLLTIFIFVAGLFSFQSMRVGLIPALEFQSIRVQLRLPGATPEEMEKFVLYPLEDVLKNTVGVERLKSYAESGYARLNLQYKSEFRNKMDNAVEKVKSRVDGVLYLLPQDIRDLKIEHARRDDEFLYYFTIQNLNEEDFKHRQFYENFVSEVKAIPGVIEGWSDLRKKEVLIELSPEKLKEVDVSVLEVRRLLDVAIQLLPVGTVKGNDHEYAVQLSKSATSLEDIMNLPLRSSKTGVVIPLSKVAQVKSVFSKKEVSSRVNGHPAVSLGFKKDLDTDILVTKEKVVKIVEKYNNKALDNIKIISPVNGPQFIELQLEVLKKNGLLGFCIVFLLLWYFLGLKTSAMASFGLPLSYFGTLIILNQMGINIDLLSIIGMILVIGILVDDAVIVSERYVENLKEGYEPRDAALKTVKELIKPVTGTVFTTVVAFSPILLTSSEFSTFLFAVPVIVILSLTWSYIECFFILPNHLADFVKSPPKERKWDIFRPLSKIYNYLLHYVLKYRYLGLVGLTVFFVISMFVAAKKVKHNFNLSVNSEKISIYMHLKKSGSLNETVKVLKPIEQYLMTQFSKEDIGDVSTDVGQIWDHGQEREGFRYAKLNAYIAKSNKHPSIVKKRVLPKINEFLEKYKKSHSEIEKLTAKFEMRGSDEERKGLVTVQLKGAEDVSFYEIEGTIKAEALKLSIINEYIEDTDQYLETWEFHPQVDKLLRYGVGSSELATLLRSHFTQDFLSEIRMDGESVPLYTKLALENEPQLEELANIELQTSTGLNVPLKYLGHWKKINALKKVSHLDGQRNLNMDFKINEKEGNIELAQERLEKALGVIRKKYPTYDIEVVNSDENAESSKAWAIRVALLCILGVLFVIALVLGSVSQAVLVGLPIPFGIMGIIWALYFHSLPLGLMALIGLVGTIGVSVNASIVMVDQINKFSLKAGGFSRESLMKGSLSRLRPIVLTTLTTLFGVFPMAYSLGGESGFTQPLAFSMGWGLSFSTVLTLFFLPALILILEDVKSLLSKVISKFKFDKKTQSLEELSNENRRKVSYSLDKDPVYMNPSYNTHSVDDPLENHPPKIEDKVKDKKNEPAPPTVH